MSVPPHNEAIIKRLSSCMRRTPSPAPQADLWRVEHSKETRRAPAELLSADEIKRALSYRFERDRLAFIWRHACLRGLIGQRLECEPKSIRFSTNEYGKPQLEWPPVKSLCFSIAQTVGVALLAIAQCESVGVDIERVHHNVDFFNVGSMVFSERELAQLRACAQNTIADQFFRLWTRKEAYLKVLGRGFMCDPRLFSVTDFNRTVVGQAGQLFELELGKTFRGAIAVR